jgi:hypothetical protein
MRSKMPRLCLCGVGGVGVLAGFPGVGLADRVPPARRRAAAAGAAVRCPGPGRAGRARLAPCPRRTDPDSDRKPRRSAKSCACGSADRGAHGAAAGIRAKRHQPDSGSCARASGKGRGGRRSDAWTDGGASGGAPRSIAAAPASSRATATTIATQPAESGWSWLWLLALPIVLGPLGFVLWAGRNRTRRRQRLSPCHRSSGRAWCPRPALPSAAYRSAPAIARTATPGADVDERDSRLQARANQPWALLWSPG